MARFYGGQESDKINIIVLLKMETDKAVMINYEGDNIWLPKSQIEFDGRLDLHIEKEIEIQIPEWLAVEKDMV